MLHNVFAACALLASVASALPQYPAAVYDKVARGFDYKSAALTYVGKQWGVVPSYSLQFQSVVEGTDTTSALLRQAQNGVAIDNTYATVVFDQSYKIIDFEGKKADFTYVYNNLPSISLDAAIAAGEQALPGATYTGTWNNDFAYLAVPGAAPGTRDTGLVFNYVIGFKDNKTGVVNKAYVDALTAQVRQI